MWDNIGRNIGEMAYLGKISRNNYIISQISQKNISNISKFENGAIFISAHIGNWELCPTAMLKEAPFVEKINVFYKEMNNPMVNNFLINKRKSEGIKFIKKSSSF